MMQRWILMLAVSLFVFAPDHAVLAQGPGGPPRQAFSACQGKQADATCSFRAPHGTIKGSCRQMPPGFVCVPSGFPGGGHGRGQAGSGPGRDSGQGGGQRGEKRRDQGQRLGQNAGSHRGPPGYTPRPPHADAIRLTNKLSDTGQVTCFDNNRTMDCPSKGSAFFGQDGHYKSRPAAYRNNGDGTVSDPNTGLMWQKEHNRTRLPHYDAKDKCDNLVLGGHSDWRMPTIKELFSIADFSGATGHRFFIDSKAFDLEIPGKEILEGDRFDTHFVEMMGQTWSQTYYTGDHMDRPGIEAAFFFNYLDGHLKQAPTRNDRMRQFYRCVRGKEWGINQYQDQKNGTVSDNLTGLVWQQEDDGKERDWPQSLDYCENLSLAGRTDWRLPNIKELHSIIDYSRYDPAIDTDIFVQKDRDGWFWSSTTHGDTSRMASYICFGKCISVDGRDVHGAGAQRSDPKTGDPSQYTSLGGQRDQVRINNYARCVADVQ